MNKKQLIKDLNNQIVAPLQIDPKGNSSDYATNPSSGDQTPQTPLDTERTKETSERRINKFTVKKVNSIERSMYDPSNQNKFETAKQASETNKLPEETVRTDLKNQNENEAKSQAVNEPVATEHQLNLLDDVKLKQTNASVAQKDSNETKQLAQGVPPNIPHNNNLQQTRKNSMSEKSKCPRLISEIYSIFSYF